MVEIVIPGIVSESNSFKAEKNLIEVQNLVSAVTETADCGAGIPVIAGNENFFSDLIGIFERNMQTLPLDV